METEDSSSGPAILFTHRGISYEYRESLGTGPHGEALVLARKRTQDNILEEVIVKCGRLPPGEPSAQTLRLRARLEEEARLAEYLRHRALLRVLCVHETPEALYTVCECFQGPTLDDLVTLALERQEPFSEGFLLYVGAELASALDHVHTCQDEHGQGLGIVHRNISPPSIGFTGRGGVKLADFSLAYSNLPGRRETTQRRPRGPLFFTAPETLFLGRVDGRSDLFALGLVLLELATGRHLYDPAHKTAAELEAALTPLERKRVEREVRTALRAGYDDTTQQALWGAATFTREDVERAADGVPAPARSMVERLLRREPGERFQTAAELEQALRARLSVLGPYDGAAAVAEVQKAVTDVGKARVAEEVNPGLFSPRASRKRSSQRATTR
jgi:serine/threonine-protein kinase